MDSYKNLVQNKSFLRFFASINFMLLAQSFATISIFWLVYEETRDPFLIGIFGTLMQLPQFIFGPIVSRILDRKSIHKAMMMLLVVRICIFVTIFLIPLGEPIYLYMIAILLSINSSLSPALSSGMDVMVAQTVDKQDLVTANSLLTIFFDISYIFGSIAVSLLSLFGNKKVSFLIAAILLSFSVLVLKTLTIDDCIYTTNDNLKDHKKQSLLDSLKYIVGHREILVIVILTIGWNMFTWGTFSILLPIYIEHNLNQNIIAYGILNSMQSVGIIVCSLFLGSNIIQKIALEKVICIGIMLHCIVLSLFYFSQQFEWAISLLIIAGAVSAPVVIYKSTYFQQKIPREIMGQVLSVILVMSSLFYSFGAGIMGYLLNRIGTQHFSWVNLMLLSTIGVMSFVELNILSRKKATT